MQFYVYILQSEVDASFYKGFTQDPLKRLHLQDEIKKDKLKVAQWADKSVTAAAVFNTVSKTLFETLPYPTYETDDIDLRTNLV